MNLVAAHGIAALAGAAVAIPWMRLVLAAGRREAGKAAMSDFLLIVIGGVVWQVWAMLDYRFSIFVAEAVGSSCATYCAVRWWGDAS